MQQAIFGQSPSGERLERIKRSPKYRDGQFQNLRHTPALSEGSTHFQVLYEFLFTKTMDRYPADSIPSVKTELRQLPLGQDVLVW